MRIVEKDLRQKVMNFPVTQERTSYHSKMQYERSTTSIFLKKRESVIYRSRIITDGDIGPLDIRDNHRVGSA